MAELQASSSDRLSDEEDSRPEVAAPGWAALLQADAADWALALVALVAGLLLESGEPVHLFMLPSDALELGYPLVPSTVPSSAVLPIAFLLPVAVLCVLRAARLASRPASARLLLGAFAAASLCFLLTNSLKLLCGRPRPSFAARCWPGGQAPAGLPGVPACAAGDPKLVREGRKSFPSGHSSMSTVGCAYAAAMLLSRLPKGPRGGVARLCAALSPLLLALFVGVTRVTDYWHWPSDVAAGGAIGGGIAVAVWSRVQPAALSARTAPAGAAASLAGAV